MKVSEPGIEERLARLEESATREADARAILEQRVEALERDAEGAPMDLINGPADVLRAMRRLKGMEHGVQLVTDESGAPAYATLVPAVADPRRGYLPTPGGEKLCVEMVEASALDAANARIAELEAALVSADPWARFGDIVFERFWSDGLPGDLEGGDLQEIARDCGLLGRTAEVDAGATHAEGCGWEPGMPMDDCDCWAPMLGPYRSAVREQEGTDA